MAASDDAEQQLAAFLAKYSPEIAEQGRAAVDRLAVRLPWADRLVYDNYNALAVGFGPGERPSDAIFSIALFPKWVTLFFLKGAALPDPDGLLEGKGSTVRSIRLIDGAPDLERPDVQAMIDLALASEGQPADPVRKGRLVIKSISAKQRPRKPA
ncbi:hypothetical protein [Parasphingopyxis marina]|uniref:YdhG-like domain-containing protein n=1 Tax=Parasphingopyxis marina TaxID=2761622 RepID=A0A842HV64_9SPHN|nr:hypothetical protein [Parasphingopyxis marina]MBC2776327.1 hypothetical protein [Parasphingopyxis marina]